MSAWEHRKVFAVVHTRSRDQWLSFLLSGAALVASSFSILIFIFLLLESWPVLRATSVGSFFFDESWHPTEGLFNLVPMIAGTILVVFGAVALATPLGICLAVFQQFYAPCAMGVFMRLTMELLAGIPSVVYGLLGIVVLVPLINQLQSPGASLLAAMLTLALMILPMVVVIVEADFQKIPRPYLLGAEALGFTRWTTIKSIIFPATSGGIFAGIILQTGRAVGETMAVMMVCGNIVQVPNSLFDPMRTLSANIALEMAYATGNHRSALFLSGLILMTFVTLLVFVAGYLQRIYRRVD